MQSLLHPCLFPLLLQYFTSFFHLPWLYQLLFPIPTLLRHTAYCKDGLQGTNFQLSVVNGAGVGGAYCPIGATSKSLGKSTQFEKALHVADLYMPQRRGIHLSLSASTALHIIFKKILCSLSVLFYMLLTD